MHVEGLSLVAVSSSWKPIFWPKNNQLADANRNRLFELGQFALNFVSSPGSGKTTLLVETIKALAGTEAVAVI